MSRLSGLSGLYGPGQLSSNLTDAGVLEAHGFSLDPRHKRTGDTAGETYPAGFGKGYTATAYSPEIVSGTAGVQYPSAEDTGLDNTPTSHHAPYMRGILQPDYSDPDSFVIRAEEQQAQRKLLHGSDLGAPGKFNRNSPAGHETPAHYTTDRYTSPSVSNLSSDVPGQIRGTGTGLKGTDQGYGSLNNNPEFRNGHSIRRVQHDTLHWDHSLSYAPPHPLRSREYIPARFDIDSPYGVLGDTSTGQQVMERRGYPSPPLPPAPPVQQPAGRSVPGEVWVEW